MLLGKLPYENSNRSRLYKAIIEDKPIKFPTEFSIEAQILLGGLLNKNVVLCFLYNNLMIL